MHYHLCLIKHDVARRAYRGWWDQRHSTATVLSLHAFPTNNDATATGVYLSSPASIPPPPSLLPVRLLCSLLHIIAHRSPHRVQRTSHYRCSSASHQLQHTPGHSNPTHQHHLRNPHRSPRPHHRLEYLLHPPHALPHTHHSPPRQRLRLPSPAPPLLSNRPLTTFTDTLHLLLEIHHYATNSLRAAIAYATPTRLSKTSDVSTLTTAAQDLGVRAIFAGECILQYAKLCGYHGIPLLFSIATVMFVSWLILETLLFATCFLP